MRKFYKTWALILFSVAFIGCIISCGSEKNKNTYSISDVTVGEIFEISLKSYSGTPYSWEYQMKPISGIEFISSEFIPENDNPDWIGGGTMLYTFKAVNIGNYEIEFLARHCAEHNLIAEINVYQINVIK